MKDLAQVLKEAGAAREENTYFGKILDEGIEALKADFGDADAGAEFPVELERELCEKAVGCLQEIAAFPEKDASPLTEADRLQFGVLLSGIISNQNGHSLSGLDIEEPSPEGVKAVKKILTREWCIDDGSEVRERVEKLLAGDYTERFKRYMEASAPEELYDEDMDELDRSSEARAWRFAKTFSGSLTPENFAAWDLGRATMIARWGAFAGYITRKEADDYLKTAADKASKSFGSFRAYAQSYIMGALLYKFICEEPDAGEFIDRIFDSICELLRGEAADGIGQWREFGYRHSND